MLGRYAISIVIGSIVTVTLLFVMQLLIVTGKQALTKPRERYKLEFVRVKRNENLNVEDIIPAKPPKPPERGKNEGHRWAWRHDNRRG